MPTQIDGLVTLAPSASDSACESLGEPTKKGSFADTTPAPSDSAQLELPSKSPPGAIV